MLRSSRVSECVSVCVCVSLATSGRPLYAKMFKQSWLNITMWRVSVHNVVRAIQLIYRKWQNSDPRCSETLQDIEMRFWVLDYVVEDSPQKNLGSLPPKG